MTSRDLVYWLQGFAEIHGEPPTAEQWKVIKNHLNMVFVHEIDPSMPDPSGKVAAAHAGVVDHAKPVKLPRPPGAWDKTLIRC